MKKGAVVALAVVIVIFTAAAGGIFAYLHWIGTPTEGSKIARYDRPDTALLVVDLQEDFTGPNAVARARNSDSTVLVAGRLVAQALGNGRPVAYIRAIYDDARVRMVMGGIAAPDEPGSRVDRRLPSAPSIEKFTKTRGDAFSNPDLDAWLRKNHVNHVVIVGLDAFYCIDDTIHGALNRGYKVTAHMDAITTGTDRDISEIAAEWRAAGVEIK